ncbi:PLEKHD1, partial [Symbiodinium sp. KB8]
MASDSGGIKAKFQRAGYMWKLPMKECVVAPISARGTDGFLLYYDPKKSPEDPHFDNKPKGVIPLGGCSVELIERGPKESGMHGLKVTHPDFYTGRHLVLCAESEDEQRAWFDALNDCGRVTMENALLGEKMIRELKEQGASTEAQREAALAQLKSQKQRLEEEAAERARLETEAEEAERLRAAQAKAEEERARLEAELAAQVAAVDAARTEREKAQAEAEAAAAAAAEAGASVEVSEAAKAEMEAKAKALEAEKARMEELASKLESQVDEMSGARQELTRELDAMRLEAEEMTAKVEDSAKLADKLKKEQSKRKKLEKKLRIAEDSLKRLDEALRRSGVKLDIDVFADVRTLRSFFEERVEEVKRDAQKIDTMKAALGAKKKYKAASGSL